MKIYFRLFVIFFLLILKSNSYGIRFVNGQYVPADYVVIADKITAEVVSKLTEHYNMKVIGIGGGMADCVNVISVSFQIRGPLSQENLREIMVDCVETFLIPINDNEKLRPFLKNYPFTPNELRIAIFIVDETGRKVLDPEIMLATASRGEIIYRTVDKDAKFGYKQEIEEDYETALQIVRKTKK